MEKTSLKDEMEGKITVSVRINNVPLSFWEEFKKDAEINFANNYIMKIMSDHYKVKNIGRHNSELAEVICELNERISKLEAEKKAGNGKENKISTFGGV